MGRPLKIAKSQAVVTLTDTAAATGIVTTSANFGTLGITAGMPFVVASTVGGLTTATVYWILSVVNSGSNSTFTVSATALSANPTRTAVTLTNTTGQSVALTIVPVDAYFNNPNGGTGYPATNANTFSVVGGLTTQFGKQALCNVAIGANGVGTLYTAGTANTSAVIGIVGSNVSANVVTGTAFQYTSANINGSTDYNNLGFASATFGNVNIAVANTNATGNIIGTSGNASNLTANLPVIFNSTFGNITANSTYFVKTIINAAAFTVSLTQGGANLGLTTNASVTANALQGTVTLTSNALTVLSNSAYIQSNPEAGYIVRQKGKQKYLVKGTTSGLTGQCYTANVANTAMTPNSMTITATFANAATIKVQSLSDHTAELFSATSGPIATGNIVLANATPAFATFNTAIASNVSNAQPFPLVQIGNS